MSGQLTEREKLSKTLAEGEKFFQEHGYYPTTYVPRKPVLRQTAIDRSDAESGQRVASIRRRHFHRPWCRWAKEINRLDMIVYESRHEAIKDGKLPCKYGCQS